MKVKVHHHECFHCGEQFSCSGELERNEDGWPEVICYEFHRMEQRACPKCAG
jgi:hypothetical protein